MYENLPMSNEVPEQCPTSLEKISSRSLYDGPIIKFDRIKKKNYKGEEVFLGLHPALYVMTLSKDLMDLNIWLSGILYGV